MNRRHWAIFLVCAVAFLFDSFDLQVISLVAPILSRQWHLSAQVLGVVIASASVGMLIGSVLFGMLSDVLGRRSGLQITIAIFAIFSGLCALAQNAPQLIVLRFLVGVGIGGFVPVDTAVLTEYMPAKYRGRLLALWGAIFPVGGFFAAALAVFILPHFGWQGLFLLGVIPALLILGIRMLIPETPRFLLMKGRVQEAEQSLRWLTQEVLPAPLPVVTGEVRPVREEVGHNSFAGMFSPVYRRRTLLALGLWFFWNFSYFGLILWLPTLLTRFRGLPLATVVLYVAGFQAAGIVGRLIMLPLVDWIGRRPIIIIGAVAAGLLQLLFGLQAALIGLVLIGYALAFFHDGGFSGVAPYTPELYPTRLRATGVGWANGAGRLAAILAPLLVGILVAVSNPYIVFVLFAVSFLLAALVVTLLGNETKGQVLEQASLDGIQPEEVQPSHAVEIALPPIGH